MAHQSILILGGTAEARELAAALAARPDIDVIVSLAGRTRDPVPQSGRLRVGGFGGAEGLARYLRDACVDRLVDATHPFARRISANAAEAARATGVPLLVLCRPPWTPLPGDLWTSVADMAAAAQAIGAALRRVFLAIGRQEVATFRAAPQHRYLVRSVEPVSSGDALPHAEYILGRGPFAEADERRLLERHRIEVLVAKNSGGDATYGKIAAARTLGLPVIMLERALDPQAARSVAEALAWLGHAGTLAAKRGV